MNEIHSQSPESYASIPDEQLRGYVWRAIGRAAELGRPLFIVVECGSLKRAESFDAGLPVPISDFLQDCVRYSFPTLPAVASFAVEETTYPTIEDAELRASLEGAVARAGALNWYCVFEVCLGSRYGEIYRTGGYVSAEVGEHLYFAFRLAMLASFRSGAHELELRMSPPLSN